MIKIMRYFSIVIAAMMLMSSFAYAEMEGVNARSSILIDAETGTVIYEDNADERLPIASVTKTMTMLLIMEAIDTDKLSWDEMVTCSEYAASMGGSQVYLEPGEQMTVKDMLKAIAVASGNDAAVAMAEHVMGSEDAFVSAMNKRAKELGMNNTNFMNVNGLDTDNHYSSARDVAIASAELLRHPQIIEYLSIWMDTLRNGEFGLSNTNKLIRFYNGANGIKTGSTSEAQYCLSASALRDGLQLIAVVLGAPTTNDRFNSASKLLDYGFANYSVYSDEEEVENNTIKVLKGAAPDVIVMKSENPKILIEKGKSGSVEKQLIAADSLNAPVSEGMKVGEIKYMLDGEELKSVDIVTRESVERINIWNMITRTLVEYFCSGY